MATGETAARRLSIGGLLDIASQEAANTYLAGLPKDIIETVDMALLVNDSVLPVHRFVMISSSAMFRDLLSSQASRLQADQVHIIPLVDDGQECVQDALAYMYKRMVLSTSPPKVTSVAQAKHLVQFGHKYGLQVLLDESDAFISRWCKDNLVSPNNGSRSAYKRKQYAESCAKTVLGWMSFAEGASLELTTGVCESWFVGHIWELDLHYEDSQSYETYLSDILAMLSGKALANILYNVAKQYRKCDKCGCDKGCAQLDKCFSASVLTHACLDSDLV